jgi:hypothetical protein
MNWGLLKTIPNAREGGGRGEICMYGALKLLGKRERNPTKRVPTKQKGASRLYGAGAHDPMSTQADPSQMHGDSVVHGVVESEAMLK